jgi:DNA-binding MarR family transcriptional regulator
MGTTNTAANGDGSSALATAGRLIALFRAVEGCSHALRGAIERLAGRHQLNATQLLALWACGESVGGVGQSELANRIGVSPAQASALVEQLRQLELLEARRTENDRRRQHWSVTSAGRAVVDAVVDDLAALAGCVGTTIGANQQKQLDASLANLTTALAEPPPSLNENPSVPRLRVVSHDEPPDSLDNDCVDRNNENRRRSPREVRR